MMVLNSSRDRTRREASSAAPGICTRSLAEENVAPKTAYTPVQPSRPIVAISMMLPSA
jgi:hypothetical protein